MRGLACLTSLKKGQNQSVSVDSGASQVRQDSSGCQKRHPQLLGSYFLIGSNERGFKGLRKSFGLLLSSSLQDLILKVFKGNQIRLEAQ